MLVTIPEGVTSIGDHAFEYCDGLKSVTIPSSVTSIGLNPFVHCRGLTSISVASGNTKYDSRNNCKAIIEKSTNTLIAGCKNTVIPSSVTSIGERAFEGCEGLWSVTIPSSVTSIGDFAFEYCDGLKTVTIPEGVTSIGHHAFAGCSSLKTVTISSSVTSIGENAFLWCYILNRVTINSNAIMSNAYLNKIFEDQVKEYIIGWGVTSIGDYVFRGCNGMTSVTIPSSVTSIGTSAFQGCTSLTSVKIPSSVTSIGGSAFYGCSGLGKVIVPDLAAWCGISFSNNLANPLYYAKHLYSNENTEITNLVIPEGVTNIRFDAFFGCSGLTSVTIPSSVTSIGQFAFDGCLNLWDIYCYAVSCPEVSLNSFSEYSSNLYVPSVSLQQYKSHPVWGEFYYICPLDVSEITDIEGDGNGLEIEAIYDLNGQRQPALRPGINIIKMSDGTIKKVMVK